MQMQHIVAFLPPKIFSDRRDDRFFFFAKEEKIELPIPPFLKKSGCETATTEVTKERVSV